MISGPSSLTGPEVHAISGRSGDVGAMQRSARHSSDRRGSGLRAAARGSCWARSRRRRDGAHGEPGRRRFPALQQYRQPGRHRARLQGERGLDHRGLVEPVARAVARPCCAARWSRASIISMRSTMTAAANGRARPSCARATRNSPSSGTEDCLARGFDRTGFFEVDTGEQPSWTVQLTEFGEQAPQHAAAVAHPAGASRRRYPAAGPAPSSPSRSRN